MYFNFITVNYNGSDYTREFIENVLNLKKDHDDFINIIITDNNSSESDKIKLKNYGKKFKNLEIIFLNQNLGYFGGLNEGIKKVKTEDESYTIICNNDLTFQDDFLQTLKTNEYDENCLAIAPNIITKDGVMQNPHVIKEVPKSERISAAIYYSNYYIGQLGMFFKNKIVKKIFKKKYVDKSIYKKMKIKRGIGACYVLTPKFFKHYDLLDDRVFMWGEEVLLSEQIENVGGNTIYDPTLKILHHESATVSKITSKDKYNMVKKSYAIYKKYL